MVSRAWVHGEQREYARAADRYGQADPPAPDDPDPYNGRGWAYLELYDYGRAKADFDQALTLNPQHGLALFNRGRVLMELGQLDAALADLDAAERAKADTHYVPVYRGWVLAFKGDHARARAEFQKAVPALVNDPSPYNGLCWAHAHLRRIRQGDAALRQGRCSWRPTMPRCCTHARFAKFRMGAHGVALADFDRAIALKPDGTAIYADRGQVHEARDDRARAVADYQKAVSLPSKGYYDDIAKAEALRRLTSLATAPPQAVVAAPKPDAPQAPERRVALVIGKAAYSNVPALLNPKNDAGAVAASLRRLGFAAWSSITT